MLVSIQFLLFFVLAVLCCHELECIDILSFPSMKVRDLTYTSKNNTLAILSTSGDVTKLSFHPERTKTERTTQLSVLNFPDYSRSLDASSGDVASITSISYSSSSRLYSYAFLVDNQIFGMDEYRNLTSFFSTGDDYEYVSLTSMSREDSWYYLLGTSNGDVVLFDVNGTKMNSFEVDAGNPIVSLSVESGHLFIVSGGVDTNYVKVFNFFVNETVDQDYERKRHTKAIDCYNHQYSYEDWDEIHCFVITDKEVLQYCRLKSVTVTSYFTWWIRIMIVLGTGSVITIMYIVCFSIPCCVVYVFFKKIKLFLRGETFSKGICVCFSDVVNSTKLWEAERKGMEKAVQLHDEIVRKHLALNNGKLVKQMGDGFLIVFEEVGKATRFALNVQKEFKETRWPPEVMAQKECEREFGPSGLVSQGLKIRIGLHFGKNFTIVRGKNQKIIDFLGRDINYASRIESYGIGARTLVSSEFYHEVLSQAPELLTECEVQKLPSVWLKGMRETRTLYCLGQEGRMFEEYGHFNKRKQSVVGALTRFFNNSKHDIIDQVRHMDPLKLGNISPISNVKRANNTPNTLTKSPIQAFGRRTGRNKVVEKDEIPDVVKLKKGMYNGRKLERHSFSANPREILRRMRKDGGSKRVFQEFSFPNGGK